MVYEELLTAKSMPMHVLYRLHSVKTMLCVLGIRSYVSDGKGIYTLYLLCMFDHLEFVIPRMLICPLGISM